MSTPVKTSKSVRRRSQIAASKARGKERKSERQNRQSNSPREWFYIIGVGILLYAAFCLTKFALNLPVVWLVVMMVALYGLLFRLLFLLASGSAVPDWANLGTCFTSSAAGHESRCASTVDSMLCYVCLGGYQLLQVVLELLRWSVCFLQVGLFCADAKLEVAEV